MSSHRYNPARSSTNVGGPASSTDNAIARFDGTTGKLLQNSSAKVADDGSLTATSAGFGAGITTPVDPLEVKGGATITLDADNNVYVDGATNPRTITLGVLRFEHLPAVTGTRAINVNVQASSYDDTRGMVIKQSLSGVTSAVHNQNLNLDADIAGTQNVHLDFIRLSKVGDKHATCSLHGLDVGEDISPVVHHSGSAIAVTEAFTYDGGTFTDVTTALGDTGTDVQLFAADNDYLYIGHSVTFRGILVELATVASGLGIGPIFQYYNGAWTALPCVDNTNGFKESGTIAFDAPSDWTTVSVNGSSRYWVRIRRTRNTLVTPPTEDRIRIIVPVDYYWDADGNVYANGAKLAGLAASRAVVTDASKNLASSSVTSTELGYLSGVTSAVQTQIGGKVSKAGDTMSGALLADGGVDVTATGGSDVLNIGTSSADIVNIGRSGAQVNLQGTTAYQNVTNLEVTDKNITINKGGAAASGTSAGLEVEEDSSITGYCYTSGDRNSWVMKAPNTAGVATVTPGAGGITLNQSSHNPLTLGVNTNGLSLTTQVLSMAAADTSTTGSLTSTDWNKFNNKLAIDSVVAISSDTTLTDRAVHLVDTSAARALTLPSPAATRYIVIKDKTGSADTNNITIVRAAAEKIETVAASFVLDIALGSWTFVSDGTDWFII